ncbi:2-dehydropantoate 2-reductase [Bacillus sp. 31A1R]|uniref:2-dehydropantoate 2-reductase n=1 Tax=Robertmurraya mangrovi TaxID=3098077 RepID=A0ABU5IU73_9BACI|nr:2-dehydropantoate 2-reductase [Bacillus sp. 31A1R]MDZ5470689.1 2-dehydropantoate 2-reductase [Bacillus sp. 31A1R]
MRIGIIGGGSIGLLISYYLSFKHEVTVYTRTSNQKKKLLKEGVFLERSNNKDNISVNAKLYTEWSSGTEDLTVFCVKQYQLTEVIQNMNIGAGDHLLFLQNGMGHLKLLESLNIPNIYVGVIEHGAYRINNNTVSHTGIGIARIANFKGVENSFIRSFTLPLKDSFPFVVEENYMEMLLKKLVVNAVINPLTAILKTPNGKLIENPYYKQLFDSLFNEVNDILQLEAKNTYYQNLVDICKQTANNRSSMLKDIEENRKTEVDAILGYLIEVAAKKEIDAPIVNTYYHSIKGMEFEGEGK